MPMNHPVFGWFFKVFFCSLKTFEDNLLKIFNKIYNFSNSSNKDFRSLVMEILRFGPPGCNVKSHVAKKLGVASLNRYPLQSLIDSFVRLMKKKIWKKRGRWIQLSSN